MIDDSDSAGAGSGTPGHSTEVHENARERNGAVQSPANWQPKRIRAYDGSDGWRAGIEAALRVIEYRRNVLRDMQHPAYCAALDEVETFLRGMLERGTEQGTTKIAADRRDTP